jgi:exodeoxyribonuclease-3
MKIASFNINGINRRLGNLIDWLEAAEPDIVCLQELKAAQEAFPSEAIDEAGYRAMWKGQKTWNGVAILARDADPVVTRDRLPGDAADAQSRYMEAAVGGVLCASIYLPNGNPQPGPKFDYKLAWFERLISHAADLFDARIPVVLAGDFNVVPTDSDIYSTRSWADDALLQPESRAAFRRLLDQGWTDAIRAIHPTRRSTPSGTTCGTAGRGTRACASTTSCSAASWPRGWSMPASTARCAGRKGRAITRRSGRSCAECELRQERPQFGASPAAGFLALLLKRASIPP